MSVLGFNRRSTANVRFSDGMLKTYTEVKKMEVIGDFVVLRRPRKRNVVINGRQIQWAKLGDSRKITQDDIRQGPM